jgi:CubicO group peptidase (beta-lactamase class C family)
MIRVVLLLFLAVSPVFAGQWEAAVAYSRDTGHRALLIKRAGRMEVSDFTQGTTPSSRHHVRSICKPLWALAVLRACEEGLITLEEKASDTLPEWRNDPVRREIRIRHLLSMTSGLDPAAGAIYRAQVPSITKAALSAKPFAHPGTMFNYGPSSYEALGEILRRKLAGRNETPEHYLATKILRPAGIGAPVFRRDRAGTPYYSAGMSLSAADLLRLGELYLHQGSTGWRHVVKPRSIELATQGSAINPVFGLGTWLNVNASRPDAADLPIENRIGGSPSKTANWKSACIARSAPSDMITLLGSSGQRVYIVPSENLVIARLGEGGTFRDARFWELRRN